MLQFLLDLMNYYALLQDIIGVLFIKASKERDTSLR